MTSAQLQISSEPKRITIFHSPDADDAFMFYGLVSGNVESSGFVLESELADIESLNQRALRGELEVTAISVHALAFCADEYVVLRSGASMGGSDYGPRLVTFGANSSENLFSPSGKELTIACPGELTSATLALQLFLRSLGQRAKIVQKKFDDVQHVVQRGEADAGLIIHEGQITLASQGFETAVDLGAWWWKATGLPLPLGVNVAKRSLGQETIQNVAKALKESIKFSLRYRQEALEYALSFGRGLQSQQADEFVGMYVNERTVDIGEDGIESIRLFLAQGSEAGLIPAVKNLEFIGG